MTIREKLARILCDYYDDLPERATYLERKTHPERWWTDRQDVLETVDRMLDALREPSPGMLAAGAEMDDWQTCAGAEFHWRAMVEYIRKGGE